jgi:probable rRNA maturation factor
MSGCVAVELIDHQQEVLIPASWLHELRDAAQMAWSLMPEWAVAKNVLGDVESLDIALVSAAESDRIHREFMGIDGATDVITFLHGELIICPAVAAQQAAENAEPLLRELLRYIVHGTLHLAGHLDDQEKLRISMERAQEKIVALLWAEPRFRVFAEENAIFSSK